MPKFKNFILESNLKKSKQKVLGLTHLGRDTYKNKSGKEFVWDVKEQNFILKTDKTTKTTSQPKETTSVKPFSIPEKLKANFKIEGNLSNVDKWKAKIFSNNSSDGTLKVGSFQDVGYVLISLDSDTIIPVARNDEHRKGYELMYDYIKMGLIPKEKYVSVFSKGHDYFYSTDEKDSKERLQALKKWRSYGGANFQMDDGDKNYIGTVDDFIEADGNLEIKNGQLNPMGSSLVKQLEKISTVIRTFHENPWNSENYSKVLFKYARNLLDDFKKNYGFSYHLNIKVDDIKKYILQLDDAESKNNWKKVEEIFLSHDGIKNKIHMEIRKLLKDKNDKWSGRDYRKIFGDLEKANNEFNRIGSI